MYGLQPASMVLATESTRYPEIPKSHILTSPPRLMRMLEGLTSRWITDKTLYKYSSADMTLENKDDQLWLRGLSVVVL